MENNKNKRSVKFQGDMSNFCDFIQVFVFARNHHLKAIVIPNITVMLYQNRFLIEITRAMTKGKLCCKFQTPASNTVGGAAETPTILQSDMIKISMSYKGT